MDIYARPRPCPLPRGERETLLGFLNFNSHETLSSEWIRRNNLLKMTVTTLIAVCGIVFSLPVIAAPVEQMTIQVSVDAPGDAIPENFAGLGFEAAILREENGTHYFRPDNAPLIHLFRTLGIKSLRIGGNTSDRDVRQLPSEADLDSLFGFAKAAGVKVIYCLRLHNGDPTVDARTVKYLMDRYPAQVDCFSIGQEPSAYPVVTNDTRATTERMGVGNEKYTYAKYHEDWKKFAAVIVAAVPDVKFCGPSVHNNGQWAKEFMRDFGRSNQVALITEHLYAGGAGNKVPSPEAGRDRMLSDSFLKAYQKLYDSFVPMALADGLPYRLEEVNNYFNGGATNVSNTFASALWGLDFMYWWAEHHAAGLNFHTGDRVAAGNSLLPSKYTAFFSTTNGYVVRPLGYGIKAFDLGAHGRIVPVKLTGADGLNVRAHAVLGADNNVYLTLINNEHGDSAKDIQVTFGQPVAMAESISLTAPNGDVAATSGVTLGGGEITADGSWNGKWSPLEARTGSKMTVTVPSATAMVLKLKL